MLQATSLPMAQLILSLKALDAAIEKAGSAIEVELML